LFAGTVSAKDTTRIYAQETMCTALHRSITVSLENVLAKETPIMKKKFFSQLITRKTVPGTSYPATIYQEESPGLSLLVLNKNRIILINEQTKLFDYMKPRMLSFTEFSSMADCAQAINFLYGYTYLKKISSQWAKVVVEDVT